MVLPTQCGWRPTSPSTMKRAHAKVTFLTLCIPSPLRENALGYLRDCPPLSFGIQIAQKIFKHCLWYPYTSPAGKTWQYSSSVHSISPSHNPGGHSWQMYSSWASDVAVAGQYERVLVVGSGILECRILFSSDHSTLPSKGLSCCLTPTHTVESAPADRRPG